LAAVAVPGAGGGIISVAGEDWEPIVRGIVGDLRRGVPVGRIAARFHNSLAEIIVGVATRIGDEKVALSGGCFQNRLLFRLKAEMAMSNVNGLPADTTQTDFNVGLGLTLTY
jgi:hydrogenase maturation factor HypF (carbamoyltransferase family)